MNDPGAIAATPGGAKSEKMSASGSTRPRYCGRPSGVSPRSWAGRPIAESLPVESHAAVEADDEVHRVARRGLHKSEAAQDNPARKRRGHPLHGRLRHNAAQIPVRSSYAAERRVLHAAANSSLSSRPGAARKVRYVSAKGSQTLETPSRSPSVAFLFVSFSALLAMRSTGKLLPRAC